MPILMMSLQEYPSTVHVCPGETAIVVAANPEPSSYQTCSNLTRIDILAFQRKLIECSFSYDPETIGNTFAAYPEIVINRCQL